MSRLTFTGCGGVAAHVCYKQARRWAGRGSRALLLPRPLPLLLLLLTNSILRAAQTCTDELVSRCPAKPSQLQQIQATSADEVRANQVIYKRKPNIIVCPVSRTSKPMVGFPLMRRVGEGRVSGKLMLMLMPLVVFDARRVARLCFHSSVLD